MLLGSPQSRRGFTLTGGRLRWAGSVFVEVQLFTGAGATKAAPRGGRCRARVDAVTSGLVDVRAILLSSAAEPELERDFVFGATTVPVRNRAAAGFALSGQHELVLSGPARPPPSMTGAASALSFSGLSGGFREHGLKVLLRADAIHFLEHSLRDRVQDLLRVWLFFVPQPEDQIIVSGLAHRD